MFFCVSLLGFCVCLAQGPQRSAKERKEGCHNYLGLQGLELAQALGMDTIHGRMAASSRDRSCLGLYQHLGGATAEEGRETRSEAEGKIETDFLAGVEIMDGQMM